MFKYLSSGLNADKVVVITGSTSGIGLGIAKAFATLGANLVINGFASDETQNHIITELRTLGAKEVFYHPANLLNPSEIEEMFDQITGKFNKVDILINNAGIQFVAPIEEFPPIKWEEIIRINLIASFYTIRRVIPLMKSNKWGRIINIASAHGLVASELKSAYVAAKHGLIGLTKTAALELAEYNITVNAICPGYVKTSLVLKQIPDLAKLENISEEEVIRNVLLSKQAIKKFVEVEEIASLVIFLCNSQAASITGASLTIDGGWTAQ